MKKFSDKYIGKYRLATELMDLLVKKRIVLDKDWKRFFDDIMIGRYEGESKVL